MGTRIGARIRTRYGPLGHAGPLAAARVLKVGTRAKAGRAISRSARAHFSPSALHPDDFLNLRYVTDGADHLRQVFAAVHLYGEV